MLPNTSPQDKQQRDPHLVWSARSPELAEWTDQYLVNRRDVWGGYYLNGGKVKIMTKPNKKDRDDRLLATHDLRRHYSATDINDVIGLHTTSPDNLSRWAAIDIDFHGEGGSDSGTNARAALAWYRKATNKGLHPLLTDSNGNGGYHLRLIFDKPVHTPAVFNFIRSFTDDHKSYGMEVCCERFPKQSCVKGEGQKGQFGNWLRLPGRHPKRPHWSRVFDGEHWLSDNDAIDFILSLTGDPIPFTMTLRQTDHIEKRIAAYLEKLPNRGEGQGRDDIAFGFACFLVRDLKQTDADALRWLSAWDQGNTPPKGDERLKEIVANAHEYGQRPYGAGLDNSRGACLQLVRDEDQTEDSGDEEDDNSDRLTLQDLALKPGKPRQTPSGKIVLPVRVYKKDKAVDQFEVASSSNGRREAALSILRNAPSAPIDKVNEKVAELVTLALELFEAVTPEEEDDGLRDRVREFVEREFIPVQRVGKRIFFEGLGEPYDRTSFLHLISNEMLAACGDERSDRYELLGRVEQEMRLLFGDLLRSLPDERSDTSGVHKNEETGIASAVIKMFSKAICLTKTRDPKLNTETTKSISLKESVLAMLRERVGEIPHGTWRQIHPAHPAFVSFLDFQIEGGELIKAPALAFNSELSDSATVKLPDGITHWNLKRVGKKAKLFCDPLGANSHDSSGKTRVIVLSLELTRHLLYDPTTESPTDSSEGVRNDPELSDPNGESSDGDRRRF